MRLSGRPGSFAPASSLSPSASNRVIQGETIGPDVPHPSRILPLKWRLKATADRLRLASDWLRLRREIEPGIRSSRASSGEFRGRALLDLRTRQLDGPQGRFAFTLAAFLSRGGFEVVVRRHPWFLANAIRRPFKRAIFDLPGVLLENPDSPPQSYDLRLIDQRPRRLLARQEIWIHFTPDRYPDPHSPILQMPFPLFPGIYLAGEDRRASQYRLPMAERPIPLLFAGRLVRQGYEHPEVEKRYGCVNRHQAIETLRRELGSRWIEVNSKSEWERLLANPPGRSAVFLRANPDFTPENWLPTLARARVFLGLPGTHKPQCHNLSEALAVGAVPLLEYGHLFKPPLRDGVDSAAYRGTAGLIQRTREMLSKPAAELQPLSDAAARYHDQHIDARAVVERWLAAAHPLAEVRMPFY